MSRRTWWWGRGRAASPRRRMARSFGSPRNCPGEVYIIDRANFAVSGKIEFLPPGMRKTDVTPVGLVMTKDGKTAYVTLGHAAHVAVVDVATRKVQAYILVGKRSWGITLSRDETKLFVANGFGDDITVIDTKSRKPIVSIPVGRIPWGVIIDD